jgi:hypothetical protein
MSEAGKRDAAIKRARHNPANHYEEILAAGRRWLTRQTPGVYVVAGELFRFAIARNPEIEPRERRVMGAVMRSLEKEQLIVKAGISNRVRSHKGLSQEWKRTRA